MKRLLLLSVTVFMFSVQVFSQGGNVGIGNNNPQTKLQVQGAISVTPVDVMASTSPFVLGDNLSIVRITDNSNAGANGIASVATPKEGQYLTIYNADAQAVTFAGYTIAASTGVISLNYIGGAWRLVSDNTSAPSSGSGSYIQNNSVGSNFATGQSASFDITGNTETGGTANIGGNVGIGTTSTANTLDVQGGTGIGTNNGTNINLQAQNGGTGGATSGGNINISPGTGNGGGANGVTSINAASGNVNIATGSAAQAVSINTGAGAKTTNIGSTNTTSATTINGGSGGVTVSTLTSGGASYVKASSAGVLSPQTGVPGTDVTGTVANATTAVNFSGSLAGDVSGTQGATKVNALESATTSVNISSATAPSAGQVLKATSATTATWQADNNAGGTVTQVNTGAGLTGGPITTTGTISIANGGVTNTMLANPSLTVTAGTGMSGGGSVPLGGSVTLNNAGVTSIAAGSGISVSGSTGAVTVTATGSGLTGASTTNYVPKWTTTSGTSGTLSSTSSIYDNGNVGIGTTTPGYKLQVQKTSIAAPGLMVGGGFPGGPRIQTYGLDADPNAWMGLGTDMSGGPYEHSIYYSGASSSKLTFGTYDGTTYTTKAILLNNGNFGIGTTTPAQKLEVNGNIYNRGILYQKTSDGQGSGAHGISWYDPSFVTWYDYMAPPGTTNSPSGTVAPSDVTTGISSWARRFNMENIGTYGWLFESGANTAGSAPTVKFAINASNGNFHTVGNAYIDGTIKIGGGSPATGKVLVSSDASGNATWTDPAAVTVNYANLANIPNRTNWSSPNNHRGFVAEQLSWKNYGNNHTIFDASQGTSPDGVAVNNTNAAIAWSASYPTLMGWNGANTYGVRVDAARIADVATTATTATTATNVAWSGVTSKPAAWLTGGNLIADDADFNNSVPSGFYQQSNGANAPTAGTWYNMINVRHSNTANDHGFQIAASYYDENIWTRTYQGGTANNDGTFTPWRKLLSTLNVAGTTNYVSKFTSANTIGNGLLYDDGTNVGLGTTTMGAKLSVSAGSGSPVAYRDIELRGAFASGEDHTITTRDAAGIVGSISMGYNGVGIMKFGDLYYSGYHPNTPLMTLIASSASTGNLGLGTTTPGDNLFIAGTNNVGADVLNNDGNDRPGLSIRGNYPEVNIISSVGNNTNHGATLRFVAYDDVNRTSWKHWVVGVPGQNAANLDFGYAANSTNPHAGIAGWTGTTVMRMSNNGNVGIGNFGALGPLTTTSPASTLHVMGKINLHQSGASGGQNRFEGLEDPTSANGRAQFVMSSAYSDLVIASSQANDNHGSTLTFATYNPGDATDYRKFVINQGNWGARRGFLDFGFADAGGRSNPHSNINGTDVVFTLDGFNKRLGIGTMSPAAKVEINNTAAIPALSIGDNGTDNGASYGMVNLTRPADLTRAHLAFIRSGNYVWQMGYVQNTNTFGIFPWNLTSGGTPTMAFTTGGNVGIGNSAPVSKLQVSAGNTDGIMLGNYNDQLGWNGSGTQPYYAIRFAGYRDVVSNFTGAMMAGVRINQCCSGLAQGMYFSFRTMSASASASTSGDGNLVERVEIVDDGIASRNYYGLSDKRLKSNIHPIDYGLSQVLQMQPVSYNQMRTKEMRVSEKTGEPDFQSFGFIAQDMNNVIPEIVYKPSDPDAYWAIDYSKLTPVIIKAIQQQQQQIDELKSGTTSSTVNVVQSQMDELKNQNRLLQEQLNTIKAELEELKNNK